jgi:hypothetical protein
MLQEIHMFLDTSRTLRMAQTKFQDSNDCLEKITSDSEGKTIMVPLTGSVSLMDLTKPKVAEMLSIEMIA